MTRKKTRWEQLPTDVQIAATMGLRDPEDSGAPKTTGETIDDYNSGKTVADIGKASMNQSRVPETAVWCADCAREIAYGSNCIHITVGPRGGRTRND